jgi:hypothetical protein
MTETITTFPINILDFVYACIGFFAVRQLTRIAEILIEATQELREVRKAFVALPIVQVHGETVHQYEFKDAVARTITANRSGDPTARVKENEE